MESLIVVISDALSRLYINLQRKCVCRDFYFRKISFSRIHSTIVDAIESTINGY